MDALKASGNEAVRKGDYLSAIDFYRQAISSADEDKVDDIVALHSNCSFAHLKLGEFSKALEEASKCIALKPDWSKGHFRCAEAYFSLRDYTNAEKSYEKASMLSPDDQTIKRRISLTREAIDGFYFRQLFPGRDFCLNPLDIIERQIFSSAEQMKNFVYLVGDAKTREVVVVDAAWDVKGIRKFAAQDSVKIVGAVVTHYHFDHTGGTPPPPFDALGIKVPGVREFATEENLPVYINKLDAACVRKNNGVPSNVIVELEDSAIISVGSIKLQFIHTPGHTPGSQCLLISRPSQDYLLSGDTLFIGSCGRLDLPDCDTKAMYVSLQKKLASLPDNTRVYPGHDYGGPYTTIGHERTRGLLRPTTERDWLQQHKM